MKHQLANINIARFRYEPDDPRLADFVNNLELINGLGERAEGFVWRLKDDTGNAMAIHAYDDPRIIVNLSVWASIEALQLFAYRTEHVQFFRRRLEWFEPHSGAQHKAQLRTPSPSNNVSHRLHSSCAPAPTRSQATVMRSSITTPPKMLLLIEDVTSRAIFSLPFSVSASSPNSAQNSCRST
jgi:hypothetical protein